MMCRMKQYADWFEELALSENRDLWNAWQTGELTLEEALYIYRRSQIGGYLYHVIGLPGWLLGAILWVYDFLYEPVHPVKESE